MAGLVTLAALDALSRTWFRTFFGVVTLLFAVLAGVRVDSLLGAIASTMTDLLAVDALNPGLRGLTLSLLLLAMLLNL
jgi:hypothetical protein